MTLNFPGGAIETDGMRDAHAGDYTPTTLLDDDDLSEAVEAAARAIEPDARESACLHFMEAAVAHLSAARTMNGAGRLEELRNARVCAENAERMALR